MSPTLTMIPIHHIYKNIEQTLPKSFC